MQPKTFLPSKKFMLTAGSVLGIAVVGFVIYKIASRPQTIAVLPVEEVRADATDSDGDGLKDWEEDLWGTDKKNPDSDGDGATDGAEVQEGRDPTIPAPGDEISPLQRKLLYDVPGREGGNKTTNLFNASLPTALVLARESADGNPVSQDELNSLAEPFVPQEIEFNHFTTSDVRTVTTSDETLAEYARTLDTIVARYSTLGKELEVVARAIERRDQNESLKLRATGVRYENFAKELMKIDVPTEVRTQHLRVTNGYYALSGAVLDLSAITVDPYRAIIALDRYKQISNETETAFRDLVVLIAERATYL